MNDPKKVFVINAITREDIAELLNNALEAVGVEATDVPGFAPADARLTDEVCQSIADRLSDCQTDEQSEADESSMMELADEWRDNEWLFKFPTPPSKKKAKKS